MTARKDCSLTMTARLALQFDPDARVLDASWTPAGRTAAMGNPASSMASTSERRLPFEHVRPTRACALAPAAPALAPLPALHPAPRRASSQTRETGPAPTSYSPRASADFKSSAARASTSPLKGAASLSLTSPRFDPGGQPTPGPGAYQPKRADLLGSGRGLPRATSERSLQFEIAQTPGPPHPPEPAPPHPPDPSLLTLSHRHPIHPPPPTATHRHLPALRRCAGAGAYNPHGAGRGKPGRGSAAFSSRTKRFDPPPASTPGPGAYGGTRAKPIRRSASFGSSSRRFQEPATHVPGPADYAPASPRGTPRGPAAPSSSFASSSPRVLLPSDVAALAAMESPGERRRFSAPHSRPTARPRPRPPPPPRTVTSPASSAPPHRHLARLVCAAAGPGEYREAQPLRDSMVQGRKSRCGSASFASTSARFRNEGPSTPAPGAYSPQQKFSATQRYSASPQL